MGQFLRYACLLAISSLTVSACVTTTSTTMDSWIGKRGDELISSWGAPTSAIVLDDGGKVLTWVTVQGSGGNVSTCRQSFTIDSEGTIRRWSYSGCSPVQVKMW